MTAHRPWIRYLARAGYAARGIVYLIIGGIALFGVYSSSETMSQRGALKTLLDQPFGPAIMWVMVVGLIGYIMWRLIQSLLDTDDHGWGFKGIAVRGGLLASAATYTALAIFALSLLGVFAAAGGGEGSDESPVAQFIAEFIGRNYVALGLSLVFAGVAIAHFVKAFRQKYEEHFKATEKQMKWIHPVSMIGLIARGLVFSIISLLLFYRFLSAKEEQESPPGTADAMAFIQGLPLGDVLLTAMALGIICFALYSLIEARFRRINVEDAG